MDRQAVCTCSFLILLEQRRIEEARCGYLIVSTTFSAMAWIVRYPVLDRSSSGRTSRQRTAPACRSTWSTQGQGQHLAATRKRWPSGDQPGSATPPPRQVRQVGQHERPAGTGRRAGPRLARVPSSHCARARSPAAATETARAGTPEPGETRAPCSTSRTDAALLAELQHHWSHKRPVGLERRQRSENGTSVPPSRRRRTSPLSEERNAPVRVAATRTVGAIRNSGLAGPPAFHLLDVPRLTKNVQRIHKNGSAWFALIAFHALRSRRKRIS